MFAQIVRCAALAACFLMLVGCAEVNYRGGFVAEVEDWVLFRATTKSHRLLRSYLLAASFAAIVRNTRLNDVERDNVRGRLQTALEVMQEAYFCLYPDRVVKEWSANAKPLLQARNDENIAAIRLVQYKPIDSCIFFDSRMAQADYALYKLAAEVLLDPDSQAVFADVRDRMLGDIPFVGKAVKATTKAIEAANHAAGAVYDATSLLNSLVRITQNSGGRWVYIGPIYRDVLEFDMRMMLHSLNAWCGNEFKPYYKYVPAIDACSLLDEGVSKFNKGNGDMRLWREFMDANPIVFNEIEAYPIHFAIASRWLFYTCAALYGPAKTTVADPVVEKAVIKNCGPMIEYVPIGTDRRFRVVYRGRDGTDKFEDLNAKRGAPTQIVRPDRSPPSGNAAQPGPIPSPDVRPKPGTTGQSDSTPTPH